MNIDYRKTKFTQSVAKLDGLPKDSNIEVAFVGCSNAGKSSALNTIAGINGLAKISKSPGRTQLINFFHVIDNFFLVDLPGYGYAKVPEKVKTNWQQLINDYITTRNSLRGIVLMADIRHAIKKLDQVMIDWVCYHNIPMHILLTKSDKLSTSQANNTMLKIKKLTSEHKQLISIQTFSSLQKTGVDEAREKITSWYKN